MEMFGKLFRGNQNGTAKKTANRVKFVQWVAENMRPFSIANDRAFRELMKTGPGRTNQYIPSPVTVGRDVRTLFIATRHRIAKTLQVSGFIVLMINLLTV